MKPPGRSRSCWLLGAGREVAGHDLGRGKRGESRAIGGETVMKPKMRRDPAEHDVETRRETVEHDAKTRRRGRGAGAEGSEPEAGMRPIRVPRPRRLNVSMMLQDGPLRMEFMGHPGRQAIRLRDADGG